MDNLVNQAPGHLTREEIEEIYNKNNKDVLKTLEELWEIKPKVENLDEKTIKWNNIRETCDSFDIEMKNKMLRK
jgi:chromosome segregation and condensation protein ScpB